jgi:NADH:ubiquinone oxidoreductase subunit 2 (subunit N)
VPKIGALAALFRLLSTAIPVSAVDWPLLAAVLAAATMTLGNLAVFAVATELPAATTLDSYRGLARRRPGLAAVLLVCLLGLIGTPPTGVFIGCDRRGDLLIPNRAGIRCRGAQRTSVLATWAMPCPHPPIWLAGR